MLHTRAMPKKLHHIGHAHLLTPVVQDFFVRVASRASPGGIIFDLRRRGWVTGGSAETAVEGRTFTVLSLTLFLTNEGLAQVNR